MSRQLHPGKPWITLWSPAVAAAADLAMALAAVVALVGLGISRRKHQRLLHTLLPLATEEPL